MDNIAGTTVNHIACVTATDNLIIKNSYISNINIGLCTGTSNTLIRNNTVANTIDVRNSSNAVITNNLVVSGYTYFINTNASSPNIRIEHNIFSGTINTVFAQITNAVITNNIFYGTRPNSTGAPFHSNSFSNNLVLDAFTFPPSALGGPANSGVNNITGTGPLFTNAPVSTTYNATYNYTLQAGSPCIGAATTTGENIGPSGGLYPWTGNLSLKASAIPVITLFGNSGVVPQNQPLKSNIKAKSN